MAQRVLFLTFQGYPGINSMPTTRDDLAAAVLRQRGVDVMAKVWDEDVASVETETENIIGIQPGDILIVRTIWDYHLKIPSFLKWLDNMEKQQAQIWNPVPVIRWNMHKRYLLELAEKGVPIAETKVLEKGSKGVVLADVMKSWGKIIVKPCISASGYLLKRLQTEEEAKKYQAEFEELLQERDFMVQKYIEGISVHGEWSLFFFNHQFSHAVVKVPPSNDFRAYFELGGEVAGAHPPTEILSLASLVLDKCEDGILYARVDILKDVDNKVYLGELELIEPSLYLDCDPKAPERFAEAILSRVMVHKN